MTVLYRIMLLTIILVIAAPSFASQASIHSMVIGGRTIELSDVVQVTTSADGDVIRGWLSPDGSYLIYLVSMLDKKSSTMTTQLRSFGFSDGKTTILLDSSPQDTRPMAEKKDEWMLGGMEELSWSPDSKLFVFPVTHSTGDWTTNEDWVVAMYPNAVRKAVYPMPKNWSPNGRIVWNQDGSRFIAGIGGPNEKHHFESKLCIFDIGAGTMIDVMPTKEGLTEAFRWSGDGERIQYTAGALGSKKQLREATIDGKSDKVIVSDYGSSRFSPNGLLKIVDSTSGASVLNTASGKVTNTGVPSAGKLMDWTPDSRMLTYYTEQTLSADDKTRSRRMGFLWVAGIEDRKLNRMCVALDADTNWYPSWSADCSEMAYTSQHRLHIARLKWREPNFTEKLTLNMPLTLQDQEDLKQELFSNIKQMALAAIMFAEDHDETLPSTGTAMDDMLSYSKNQDIFLFPGSDRPSFQQVLEGKLGDIEDPATVPMFTIDAGYNWKIIAYADGHARILPK